MHVACEVTCQVGRSFNLFSLFRVPGSANVLCWAKLETTSPIDSFPTKQLQDGSADLSQGSWKAETRHSKDVLFLMLRNIFGKKST